MTRRAFLGALGALALTPRAEAQAADEFYVKVLRVNRGAGELEAELTTPPKKTKIVFTGEVGEVFDGDFAKFKIRDHRWTFGGKEMKVARVTWIF